MSAWRRIEGEGQPHPEDRDDGLSLYARDLIADRPPVPHEPKLPRLHIVRASESLESTTPPVEAPGAAEVVPDAVAATYSIPEGWSRGVIRQEMTPEPLSPDEFLSGLRAHLRLTRAFIDENVKQGDGQEAAD